MEHSYDMMNLYRLTDLLSLKLKRAEGELLNLKMENSYVITNLYQQVQIISYKLEKAEGELLKERARLDHVIEYLYARQEGDTKEQAYTLLLNLKSEEKP